MRIPAFPIYSTARRWHRDVPRTPRYWFIDSTGIGGWNFQSQTRSGSVQPVGVGSLVGQLRRGRTDGLASRPGQSRCVAGDMYANHCHEIWRCALSVGINEADACPGDPSSRPIRVPPTRTLSGLRRMNSQRLVSGHYGTKTLLLDKEMAEMLLGYQHGEPGV